MMTHNATLLRFQTGDDGTFGLLLLRDAVMWACFTAELPWRKNESCISCIPAGNYVFRPVDSPKHGPGTYEAEEPLAGGRNNIQIHSANWAGDALKGFKSELLGCIAPGRDMVEMRGQLGVTNSTKTVAELHELLEGQPLKIKIRWARGVK